MNVAGASSFDICQVGTTIETTFESVANQLLFETLSTLNSR